MSLTAIVPVCLAATAFLACLQLKVRLSGQCRARLRPLAERLVIEKRWIERAAGSRAVFEREWGFELETLYNAHVPRVFRGLFRLRDFSWALDAELATITNQEIASWTFIDRVSASGSDFEKIVARCLERRDWNVTRGPRARGIGADLILAGHGIRVAVRCHYGRNDVECRGVMEVAHAAEKAMCDVACIITNGRYYGSTRALADKVGVALLHCSELDRLEMIARKVVWNAAESESQELMAA